MTTAVAAQDQTEASRTLWLMVAIQFFMTLSITVVSPVMPLFLPELGVTDAVAIDLWAGALIAVTPLVSAIVSPFWGRLSDRKGRKLMLLRSMVALSVFTCLMGFSQDVWQFLGLRTFQGAFSGFSAAAITLVGTQVSSQRLGYALGWLSTGQLLGGLMGPLLGGVVADLFGTNRAAFFVASAVATSITIIAALAIRENFVPEPASSGDKAKGTGIRVLLMSTSLLPLFVVLLVAQVGVKTVQPIITLHVQSLVGPVANLATLSGIAFSITGLADIIASPFLGKRSDTLGYRRVLLISLSGAALFSIPQAFTDNYWFFIAERFGVGLFLGGILPTANALIGRMVNGRQRGTAFGLTASATFLGNAIGPLTGAFAAAAFGFHWVFLIAAAMFLISLVWVWRAVPAAANG